MDPHPELNSVNARTGLSCGALRASEASSSAAAIGDLRTGRGVCAPAPALSVAIFSSVLPASGVHRAHAVQGAISRVKNRA